MRETNEKNFFIKKQKGITLIALVITIIVLLILAGVVIITLTGDNGLLQKAKDASIATKDAEELERVKIMTTAAKLDELGSDITETSLRKAANNEFKENSYLIEETTDSTGYKFTVNETLKEYYISKEGTVKLFEEYAEGIVDPGEEPEVPKVYITASNIKSNPSEYYGKNVNYSPEVTNHGNGQKESVTGWKVFFADDDNIYLISQNFIKCDLLAGVGLYPNATRPHYVINADNGGGNDTRVNFDNYDLRQIYSNGSSNVNDTAKSWLDQYYNKNFSSSNDNMKITAYLMDTAVWSEYAQLNIADYAIGSPTLQMIAASYNSLHPNTIITDAQSATGYRVQNTDGWMDTNRNGLDRNNSLYVADSSRVLWLASPSDADGICMVNLYPGNSESSAGIGNDNFYADNNGLRPIVRLNSSVKLTLSNDNITYDITK